MFQIDNQSRQAVYEQIMQQVEKYVLRGILKGGDKLPSTRNMAMMLHVNPNTVQRAYSELERGGVIITAPGRGAFVSGNAEAHLKERRETMFLGELKTLLTELKEAGLLKDRIIKIVEEAYRKEGQND